MSLFKYIDIINKEALVFCGLFLEARSFAWHVRYDGSENPELPVRKAPNWHLMESGH